MCKFFKTIYQSFKSPKDFSDYLDKEYRLSTRPSISRWGITSVVATILASLPATALGLLAFGFTYYHEIGKMMDSVVIIILVLVGLTVGSFIWGMCVIGRLGIYWLQNQKNSTTDILIQGIVKGASGETIDKMPPDKIDMETDKLGIKIGEYSKEKLDEYDERRKRKG